MNIDPKNIYNKAIQPAGKNQFVHSAAAQINSFVYTVKNNFDIFTLDISDFIHLQNKNGVFIRPDLIIRYLFIEQYYGKNNSNIDAVYLYKKMQDFRRKNNNSDDMVNNFHSLIKSFEKNGFNPICPVEVDRNLFIRDGSHRTSLALYLGIPKISVHYNDTDMPVERKLAMFEENGFSEAEKQLVNDKTACLLESYNKPIQIVFLPDSIQHKETLCRDIEQLGTVTDCHTLTLSDKDYKKFVHRLYSIQNISAKNIRYDKENIVCVVNFKISAPEYILSPDPKHPVIRQCSIIKEIICHKYSEDKTPGIFLPANFAGNSLFAQITGISPSAEITV